MYKIDKDVPARHYKYPFYKMEIGDSFLVEGYKEWRRVARMATYYRKTLGIGILSKREGDNAWRFWRTA